VPAEAFRRMNLLFFLAVDGRRKEPGGASSPYAKVTVWASIGR
jgi:hypothetical protein